MPRTADKPSSEPKLDIAKEEILRILRDKTVQAGKRHLILGSFVLFISALVWLLAILLFAQVGPLVFVLLTFAGGVIARWGLMLKMRPALEAVRRADNLPILLLRSFEQDESEFWDMARLPFVGDFQRSLVKKLQRRARGPVLAIGTSGRELRSFRCPRVSVADENWQEVVRQLMLLCAGVVILAGESRGLLWELRKAVRTLPPDRLLLVFGQMKPARRVRAYLYAQEIMPVTITAPPDSFEYVSFDAQWRPHFGITLGELSEISWLLPPFALFKGHSRH